MTRQLLPAALLPERTGPLDFLAGCCVLVVADGQNLASSARNLAFHLSWKKLARKLTAAAADTWAYAAFSAAQGDTARHRYYEARGWIPHAKTVYHNWTRDGWVRESNADFAIATLIGILVPTHKPDWVIYGSGDGPLGIDTADVIRQHSTAKMATLSLPGSTSNRLRAEGSPLFAANITIGRDCLEPMASPVCA